MQLDTHRDKRALEISEQDRATAYRPWTHSMPDAERGQCAGGLADVPFHRVEPVAAIGDMSDTQTFAGREQVAQSLREQGAQWDLKRIGRYIKVSASCCAGM